MRRIGAPSRQNGSADGRNCDEMNFTVRPIGFARTPFLEKVQAPRQAVAEGGAGVEGRIEMLPEHEHALADLDGFDRIWLLFWFHEAKGVRSKVLPPRSDKKRGLFATRSPHRPNPVGMSAVRLVRVEGVVIHVRDLDLIDGTPIVDIKPYVPYADSFPDAKTGWLSAADPRPGWTVQLAPEAETQLAWLEAEGLVLGLRVRIVDALALGPQPHPYRRIKKTESGELVLAVKEWRARYTVSTENATITVDRIRTGFRPRELASGVEPMLAVHRAFVTRFG